jgi:uncharacterized membrane protein YvbJ
MQTCPHCGAENAADATNCSNCGQPMKADEPDTAASSLREFAQQAYKKAFDESDHYYRPLAEYGYKIEFQK